jgi:hypothetical protein
MKGERKKRRALLLHAGRCLSNPVSRPGSCQTPPTRSRLPHSPARTRFLYVLAPRVGLQNLTARGEPGPGDRARVLIAARGHAQQQPDQQRCIPDPEYSRSASEDEEPHRTPQQGQSRSIPCSSCAFTWLPRIATGSVRPCLSL